VTVLSDPEARVALKELIEKHLKGRDPDYDRLIEIVQDPSRQVPIRSVLEDIRRYSKVQYTQQDLRLIDDLLYLYG
jgi:DNA polymerase III sliding clamp (beta) subunit (PCNA family)